MAKKQIVKADPKEVQAAQVRRVQESKRKKAVDAANAAAEKAGPKTVLHRIVKPKRAFKHDTGKKDDNGRPIFARYGPGMPFTCTKAEFDASEVIRNCTVANLDAVDTEAVEAAKEAYERGASRTAAEEAPPDQDEAAD